MSKLYFGECGLDKIIENRSRPSCLFDFIRSILPAHSHQVSLCSGHTVHVHNVAKNFVAFCSFFSCKYLSKSINKIYIYCHNDPLLLKTKVQLNLFMASNPLDHVQQEKIEAITTKFSEKFAASMLKKHKNFLGVA